MKPGSPCLESGSGPGTPAASGQRTAAWRHGRQRLGGLLGGLLLSFALTGGFSRPAQAGIPAAYAPMVIEPRQLEGGRLEFDLRAVLDQARLAQKRLYVYLGAHDCRFCRRYEAFLAGHATALKPHFAGWLVVDLRSSLSVGPDKLLLRTGAQALPYAEAMRAMGDERARMLVYPSVWLLDAQARPLMQMPAGTGTFETVPEQLEILRLEQ